MGGREAADFEVYKPGGAARREQVNEFESNCLLAFGLAALVAATFLVGQSIARVQLGSKKCAVTVRRADRDPPSWSPRWRITPSAPIRPTR